MTQDNKLFIPSVDNIVHKLTDNTDAGFTSQFIHGFEQANYGTLLHEFATPGKSIETEEEAEEGGFTVFQRRAGFERTDASQRPYLMQLYMAWKNFKNYIRDTKEPKDLKTWEGLFATPGLLTRTGFVIVRIRYPKQKDELPTIHCPSAGISIRTQMVKPPVLFLLENEETGFFDPLVFYNATTAANKKIVGVLQDTLDVFRSFPSEVQEPLRAFLTDYFSYRKGCGIPSAPIHPWMPERSSRNIPKLSELINFFIEHKDKYKIVSVAREITNRLVGLVVKEKEKLPNPLIYIPALDDGTVLITFPSLRGEEALPRPTVVDILNFYTGRAEGVSPNRLIHPDNFPKLAPKQLIMHEGKYVAIMLLCGLEIPVRHQSTKEHFDHRRFLPLGGEGDAPPRLGKYKIEAEERGDMPWNMDRALLSAPSESLGDTDEEVLDEAYQYLRISFSNWLFDPSNRHGRGVREQIEELRKARKRLPLYELQKRLDILLTSIIVNSVSPWITTEGVAHDSILRRDCLQIKKEGDCVAGCTWTASGSAEEGGGRGRCLIHTQATPRFVDPIRVMVARLSDELLRTFGDAEEILEQSISYLKPVGHEMIRTGESVLFAAKGRGDHHLLEKLGYTKDSISDFSRGFRYPEQVSDDTALDSELPADWAIVLEPGSFVADIARDPLARFTSSLVAISKKSLATLEAAIGKLTGTKADWARFATYAKQTVVFTKEVPGDLVVESVIKGGDTYVILDPDGVPFQVRRTKVFILSEEQLPPRLKAALDEF